MKFPKIDLLSSTLSSSLRLWNGTWGNRPGQTPRLEMELFDREDDGDCRLVREALTELNLDVAIYPCPMDGKRFAARRKKLAPKAPSGPLLHDLNNDLVIHSAARIVPYLFEQYGTQKVPLRLSQSLPNALLSQLASLARGPFALRAHAARQPKQLLTLYSFESSPFSRPVRERLCELELPYHLVNLGKLEWADMGPATFRLAPGPYHPQEGSKRAAFLEKYGKVQVPFLIDPNFQIEMFESQDILQYLNKTYAK
jgi:glutathione S-transferase